MRGLGYKNEIHEIVCRKKGIGNPYAGQLYVWFDEGAAVTPLHEIPNGEND